MMRSISAVIAGYAAWTALWLIGGVALIAAFSVDPTAETISNAGYLGGALTLSVACSLLGGFVCGLIARGKPVTGWVLGALLLLTGIGVQTAAWSTMPVWYHVPFLLLLVPVTLIGVRLASPKAA